MSVSGTSELDSDKKVTLVAARDEVIGEHHMVKWAIVKILIESFTFIS